MGKSQVRSNAGSAAAHTLHVLPSSLWAQTERDWRAGARASFRTLPHGPRAWLDGNPGRAGMAVTPAVSLSSRLTTLPRSLSRASATLCCRRQLWAAPSPGKGSPVGFPQFPKGEATRATFPGKCPSWVQTFLDALASPRETSWTTKHCICPSRLPSLPGEAAPQPSPAQPARGGRRLRRPSLHRGPTEYPEQPLTGPRLRGAPQPSGPGGVSTVKERGGELSPRSVLVLRVQWLVTAAPLPSSPLPLP